MANGSLSSAQEADAVNMMLAAFVAHGPEISICERRAGIHSTRILRQNQALLRKILRRAALFSNEDIALKSGAPELLLGVRPGALNKAALPTSSGKCHSPACVHCTAP